MVMRYTWYTYGNIFLSITETFLPRSYWFYAPVHFSVKFLDGHKLTEKVAIVAIMLALAIHKYKRFNLLII